MIKLAYNKENPNLVFEINEVSRDIIGNKAGIVERYVGILKDISTNPDTTVDDNFKVDVMAFESKWAMVPANIGGVAPVNNQNKEATPATTAQEIKPDTGYTGLNKVTIAAVTAAIDANIVAENIKKDVEILGVTGTYEA